MGMTIQEAIDILNPSTREQKLREIENATGIDTVSIVISKFNEACKKACAIMEIALEKGLE